MTPPAVAGGYLHEFQPAPVGGSAPRGRVGTVSSASTERQEPLLCADIEAVGSETRRLLTAWIGLALGSLVLAGVFAILVAFTRMPAVQLLPSADLFHLALVSHVTFALTVWFAAFAGVLWVYAAWRSAIASMRGRPGSAGGSPRRARPRWRCPRSPRRAPRI